MRIKEVMTESPQSCRVGDSANEAARIMWERDCGVVPIVDHAGKVAGIVTDRDICMAAYFQGLPLSQMADAERLMQERQIHRVPVVDDVGRLVGMLSLSDVARGVKRSGALAQKNGEAQELLQTVARISEPRTRQHQARV